MKSIATYAPTFYGDIFMNGFDLWFSHPVERLHCASSIFSKVSDIPITLEKKSLKSKLAHNQLIQQEHQRLYISRLRCKTKNLEEKDGQTQLLCYVSLIRACNKVL